MSMPTDPEVVLRTTGDVSILDFGDDENRVTPALVARLEAALDALKQSPGPKALITTGSGKTYSLGLDLQ